jgi:hypothetical protein
MRIGDIIILRRAVANSKPRQGSARGVDWVDAGERIYVDSYSLIIIKGSSSSYDIMAHRKGKKEKTLLIFGVRDDDFHKLSPLEQLAEVAE